MPGACRSPAPHPGRTKPSVGPRGDAGPSRGVTVLSHYAQALLQSGAHGAAVQQKPGVASSPAPAKGPAYTMSEGAGGVIQLLDVILQDATRTEAELVTGEQHAQASYASFAATCTSTIEADRSLLSERNTHMQQAMADKSETEEMLLSNGEELQNLHDLLKGVHLDCDYLLKYHKTRQAARAEEMSAINDAKAILSGANFGSEA